MKLKIVNVKGDGSCFYRCLWRIARVDPAAADDLMLEPDDLDDEDLGVRELRRLVAWHITHDSTTIDQLGDLVDLFRSSAWLAELYPVLESVDLDETRWGNCELVEEAVRQNGTYASEFEIEVFRRALGTTHLAVLACDSLSDMHALGDKWLRELHVILGAVTKPTLALLVNENDHYRLVTFDGCATVPTNRLARYVEDKMAESSDAESE